MNWWPWQRAATRSNVEQARAEFEETRAQRPRVEALAKEIRQHVVRNNFAANVFKLDPGRKR